MHRICIEIKSAAERAAPLCNMYKNGGWFLCKIDSVKRFPLHPLGKSVAAIFRRDDTEDDEIDEGAKEAE